MVTLDVNMADEKVRETLAKVREKLTPESCAVIAAEAGADVVRDHLITLSSSRHRQGQRLNFYLQAADSVIRETSGGTALLKIDQPGIAQRYYGGVINPSGRPSPVTGKPVTRLAVGLKGTPGEGHVPADFGELFVAVKAGSKKGDKGSAYLARKTGNSVQYLFTLLSSVKQSEDQTVLPKDSAILDAAAEGITDLYESVTEGRP